ncbi:Xenobiotic-transporting_ATPase / Multidrug resistance-associated protein [Hexamita inflata]|uniref:Xenobiotic-transporting ATPase / Multidrug resistance-associated protein n=1 Tax=Hexamita inflata TaxID=28002 RepID=A0AA86N8E0_9EUKA|nr:Xenobiotic-transporting ATPase / Multidrug resistance-associated protein [Hexamita inflata]
MLDFTWSWLNYIIRLAKVKQLQINDVKATKVNLSPKKLGSDFAAQFNKHPKHSVLKNLFTVNKKNLAGMFAAIPFYTLSSAVAPLCIRNFQLNLQPMQLFDCDFSKPSYINQKTVRQGLDSIFSLLYPYWIILGLGQVLRSFADTICSANCIQMGVKFTSALLDNVFNKMMLLTETTKNVNAQGSLANILFTDTMKIMFLAKSYYRIFTIPLDMIVAIIYLGAYVDSVALIGISALLIFMPVIGTCSSIMSKALKRMATLRDIRSQKIQEILNAIKVVKLFNTEQFQEKRIENQRIQEMKYVAIASNAFSGHFITGQISNIIMAVISFGSLIALNKLDITKSYTMIYLLTFIQISLGQLPIILMTLQDGIVSLNRISAFIHLSEIDSTIVETNSDFKSAIQVSGNHDFAYGLEEDQKISPNLDSAYFMKIDRHKEMVANKRKLEKYFSKFQQSRPKPQIEIASADVKDQKVVTEQPDVLSLISQSNFELTNSFCVEICIKYNFPAITFFMNIKNYMDAYFVPTKTDTKQDILLKNYMHMCVITFNLKQWDQKDKSKPVVPVIKNFNLVVPKGQLVGIQGHVGSGKSSLFSCILGEMKIIGHNTAEKQIKLDFDYGFQQEEEQKVESIIKLGGKVAFCPQNSPIFSSSIRENICFYSKYDEEKYNKIVDICCLNPDFAIFNAGDLTEVGGRGVTLSGGQRARISLARAVYNDADVYLLDDPLSAVDAHVGQRIWNEVIKDYLVSRGKTVLISSHQTHYFKDCDRILTINHGKIQQDEEIIKNIYEKIMKQPVNNRTPSEEMKNQVSLLSGQLTKEEKLTGTGNINKKSFQEYIKSGNSIKFIIYGMLMLTVQGLIQYSSILISHWGSDNYGWSSKQNGLIINQQLIQLQNNAKQEYGDQKYIISKATICYMEHNNILYVHPSGNEYYYLYCILAAIILISEIITLKQFFNFSIKASSKTYMKMLKAVIRTKLSFFDTTPQGRIINRLVKDTDSVDFTFSRYFLLATMSLTNIIVIIISICALSWPCIFVVIPCIIIYMILFSQFRSITPQLKRLESNSRSIVFSLCQEVIDNLTTIRAYNVQQNFRDSFRARAFDNVNIQYYSNSISKWMSFRMTLMGAAMAFLIVFVAMIIAPFSPSIAQYAGLIVIYGYNIQNQMIVTIEMITNTEQEMPAIERMVEYQQLEDESVDKAPKVNVPKVENNQGIAIENLVMKYRPELQPALNGVNIKINPKEHVAIVGRTGSGKSSLAITLFQLYKPESGFNIQIGNEQLQNMNLYEARRKIAIIPQEPYLFSGTLRQQLCEFTRNKAEGIPTTSLERIPDEKIWSLLEVVQLAEYVKQQPGGLDCLIVGNGDNFSSGQRQLVCVVRALLRDSQIVILDEATAYVDHETDQIIQKIVKEYLKDKIVLSIAHRLDTVLGMDKVLVMDQGKVAEFGTKEELMKINEGIFQELIHNANIHIEDAE